MPALQLLLVCLHGLHEDKGRPLAASNTSTPEERPSNRLGSKSLAFLPTGSSGFKIYRNLAQYDSPWYLNPQTHSTCLQINLLVISSHFCIFGVFIMGGYISLFLLDICLFSSLYQVEQCSWVFALGPSIMSGWLVGKAVQCRGALPRVWASRWEKFTRMCLYSLRNPLHFTP